MRFSSLSGLQCVVQAVSCDTLYIFDLLASLFIFNSFWPLLIGVIEILLLSDIELNFDHRQFI